MIHALIFDFDGLILDTETPEYLAWQEVYAEYGCTLSADAWGRIVGGSGAAAFDPVDHLEALSGARIDRTAMLARKRRRDDELIAAQPVLPGVVDLLDQAARLGLKAAVASSSTHAWVDGHLGRLGLAGRFAAVVCSEDVPPGRTKPHPDLFLQAARQLGVDPGHALVFEDSPNGVRAGRAAGMTVVAVPNPLTAQLRIEGADLVLDTLAGLSLETLLDRFDVQSGQTKE